MANDFDVISFCALVGCFELFCFFALPFLFDCVVFWYFYNNLVVVYFFLVFVFHPLLHTSLFRIVVEVNDCLIKMKE